MSDDSLTVRLLYFNRKSRDFDLKQELSLHPPPSCSGLGPESEHGKCLLNNQVNELKASVWCLCTEATTQQCQTETLVGAVRPRF